MCTADDEYDGYFIPKGTVVLGNSWSALSQQIDDQYDILTILSQRAILHDPEQYPDPLEFKPERFLKDGALDPTVQDPDSAAFGFGRRYVLSMEKKSHAKTAHPKLLLAASVLEDT